MAYQHLFFDLDHTLWDYERNTNTALAQLYDSFQLAALGISDLATFQQVYQQANAKVWGQFDENHLNKESLRQKRFELIWDHWSLPYDTIPDGLPEAFLELSPRQPYVMEGTHEVLEYLAPRYFLHIITNGFSDVQGIKMASAAIDHYFETLTTSDKSGCKKPSPGIFAYALETAGAIPEASVLIGDDFGADMLGAQRFGLDHIFYNPKGEPTPSPVQSEIRDLRELISLL